MPISGAGIVCPSLCVFFVARCPHRVAVPFPPCKSAGCVAKLCFFRVLLFSYEGGISLCFVTRMVLTYAFDYASTAVCMCMRHIHSNGVNVTLVCLMLSFCNRFDFQPAVPFMLVGMLRMRL